MKIAVLVSGGVDSSVALHLLKEQGHDCTAFYLKIWLEDELASLGTCPWEDDLVYVRRLCEQLDVPLRVINLQKEYWERVVSSVIAEVKAGRTPNPDVLCNERVKFGAFFQAIGDEFEMVATGHYADTEVKGKKTWLLRVPDPVKDQTYFLANLKQSQVARAMFPMGRMLKTEVRAYAKSHKLPTSDRKDSQGICFLGKIPYDQFLKHYLGEKEGDFVRQETGDVIGKHNGFWFYTSGQRKGISLPGGPYYVVAKDAKKNIVYVSNKYVAAGSRDRFTVTDLNWIADAPDFSKQMYVKVRHSPRFYACDVVQGKNGELHVNIETQDQGIASGQFAVFYDEKYCYGCGIIQ